MSNKGRQTTTAKRVCRDAECGMTSGGNSAPHSGLNRAIRGETAFRRRRGTFFRLVLGPIGSASRGSNSYTFHQSLLCLVLITARAQEPRLL